jgi:hypothetical protein
MSNHPLEVKMSSTAEVERKVVFKKPVRVELCVAPGPGNYFRLTFKPVTPVLKDEDGEDRAPKRSSTGTIECCFQMHRVPFMLISGTYRDFLRLGASWRLVMYSPLQFSIYDGSI